MTRDEFIKRLVKRGYARNLIDARNYVKYHPKAAYTEADLESAYDWLSAIEDRETASLAQYYHSTPEDLTRHSGSQFNRFYVNGLHSGRLYESEDAVKHEQTVKG